MSSKARNVEHGGVTWKVIPGSRREQLLMRFIRQDNALHHADVETLDIVDDSWFGIIWLWIGISIGGVATGLAWWLV